MLLLKPPKFKVSVKI